MVQLKQQSEIEKMAAAGKIVADVLQAIESVLRPGISTKSLDDVARKIILEAQATPSFLGYGTPPFPAAICASIDEEVVHGIPSETRILQEGSLFSVDVGACLDGYHGDAARTFAVGTISPEKQKLMDVTQECFWQAFDKARPGARLGDLSAAIQDHAEKHGYSIIRELTGHGIGRRLHEEPDLPNYGRPGHGLRLEPGMVIAMEPMLSSGRRQITVLDDGWTIITADRSTSAHYENTFVVTADGPVILTTQ